MIIDISYIIVLYCIVWFDQKKWFICLLQWQMTSGRMPWCWQLITQVANCHLKCFMICLAMVPCTHLYWLWMQEVLNALCIAVHKETDGWYVFLNFCNVPFCLQRIDLTHTMLLYFLRRRCLLCGFGHVPTKILSSLRILCGTHGGQNAFESRFFPDTTGIRAFR
jgi:hypothetical protein